ncbi:wax ester/triacylglycerol synthase family O-acyltransferase [Flexivirga sp. ID2601S]|uniref:Diacylglycerol O-acyltransferase n=1 Tax=Flexivirga aerilata TaxID=1656889 RepID=A0A849AHC1_9MICO|nr:wax ester/triacylglycerol synthase family O-acyltransferase [Flexivirga aerilata]
MADRLSALDASFLYLQDRTTPMHVGSVMIFDPPDGGFEYENLVSLVSNRIAYVPRYRQKVRQVPGRLLPPVWVDDGGFDVSYHVRRAALPRPGSTAQLEEFVARVQARVLDATRPLWELYLVEGLEGGRFAIVTKSHVALVDGIHAIDIGQIIVDPEAGRDQPVPHTWRASRTPSELELLLGVAVDVVRRPTRVVELARGGVSAASGEVCRIARRGTATAAAAAGAIAKATARPAPSSPLNRSVGVHRRFVMVSTPLADYRRIRASCEERVTVHDVVLATIAGALRGWLLARGEAVDATETVRVLVPLSVRGGQAAEQLDEEVMPAFVDLPVGEPRPMMRLHQIAFAMQQQLESGSAAVDAASIAGLAGFAPPTLHSLGARLGNAMSRRMFNLVVTNVPGPQQPLYAGEAPMVESYPVIPLPKGQTLAIGLTSYNGRVDFGLNADRDQMPDVDLLGQCVTDALTELLDEMEARA